MNPVRSTSGKIHSVTEAQPEQSQHILELATVTFARLPGDRLEIITSTHPPNSELEKIVDNFCKLFNECYKSTKETP